MMYFKKFLIAATLAVSSLSANAVLITQDINSEFIGTVATVTVDVGDTFLNNGLLDSSFTPEAFNLVDIEIIGLPSFLLDVFDLQIVLDGDNVFAGLEFFFIDASDLFVGDQWAYQIEIDSFAPDFNFVDIFTDPDGDLVYFESGSTLSFGKATFVPEPSTVALFGLSLLALGMRRRLN